MSMISRKIGYFSLVLLCIAVNSVKSYKILGVNALPRKSNNDFFRELIKGLADDGSYVTFISTSKSSTPIKNLTEIYVDVHNDEGREKTPLYLLINPLYRTSFRFINFELFQIIQSFRLCHWM